MMQESVVSKLKFTGYRGLTINFVLVVFTGLTVQGGFLLSIPPLWPGWRGEMPKAQR